MFPLTMAGTGNRSNSTCRRARCATWSSTATTWWWRRQRARVLDSRRHLAAAADGCPGGLGGGVALPACHGHPHESGIVPRNAIPSGRTQGEEPAGGSGFWITSSNRRRKARWSWKSWMARTRRYGATPAEIARSRRDGPGRLRISGSHLRRALTAKAGMNRFAWDLRYAPPGADGGAAKRIRPGGRRPAGSPRHIHGTADRGRAQLHATVAGSARPQVGGDARGPFQTTGAGPVGVASNPAGGGDDARSARAAEPARPAAASGGSLIECGAGSKIAALDAEAAKISLSATSRELGSALSVAESADRTPPATAYQAYDQASRTLAAQVAAWKTLLETGLGDLNRELVQNRLPAIDPGVALSLKKRVHDFDAGDDLAVGQVLRSTTETRGPARQRPESCRPERDLPYFADFRSSNHGGRCDERFEPGSIVPHHFARPALLLERHFDVLRDLDVELL